MANLSHVHLGQTASAAHALVFAIADVHAAGQWLASTTPSLSLAAFREAHLLAHANPHNATAAIPVYWQAYARRIAAIIAGGKRHG